MRLPFTLSRICVLHSTLAFALLLWQGCEPPKQCGSVSTPVGSVSHHMDYFIRPKIVGSITCEGSAATRQMEYHPWGVKCPESDSKDMMGIIAEIHKTCLDSRRVRTAGKRLVPDWIGSHSVLLVPSLDEVSSSVSSVCRNRSVEVVLPSRGTLDMRTTIGPKFVELRRDLVNVDKSSDWEPEIVSILQPVQEYMYKANGGDFQDPDSILTISIEQANLAKSIDVRSPNGKMMHIDIHSATEESGNSILVLILRKQGEDPSKNFLSENCRECLVLNQVSREQCVLEERDGYCGSDAPECKQDIATARFYCDNLCFA